MHLAFRTFVDRTNHEVACAVVNIVAVVLLCAYCTVQLCVVEQYSQGLVVFLCVWFYALPYIFVSKVHKTSFVGLTSKSDIVIVSWNGIHSQIRAFMLSVIYSFNTHLNPGLKIKRKLSLCLHGISMQLEWECVCVVGWGDKQ